MSSQNHLVNIWFFLIPDFLVQGHAHYPFIVHGFKLFQLSTRGTCVCFLFTDGKSISLNCIICL